jgi:hypothetical protein
MLTRLLVMANLAVAALALAQAPALLQNGGFEDIVPATPGADGRVSGWTLGEPPQVPAAWALNNAYPGRLTIGTAGAQAGARCVRVESPVGGSAHLFQPCVGLLPGTWYRVSAWARGGPLTLGFYEYYEDGHIGGAQAAQTTSTSDSWRLLTGFYQTPTTGYVRSALMLAIDPAQSADLDNVSIDAITLPESPAGAPDITLENDLVRLRLSAAGVVREVLCKPLGKDIAAPTAPIRVLSATRNGSVAPLYSLSREGDLLKARFLDPEIRATLRVVSRPQHILLEVTEVQPADVDSLTLEFPVRRLQTVAGAFNATYDDEVGICLFGTSVNVTNRPLTHGLDVQGLGAVCTAKHGMVGAQFALVAAPFSQFNAAIMEAERANGLPCPQLEGQWARFSEPVRRSYLFMVDASEKSLDKTIEYARIGKFGTIIFLKDNWLANHGHYDINTANFPDGRASLKRVVQKIHAAGFGAGVHVFGPSISPNDPYITPKPDGRLAVVPCPPLATALDATATTIALTAVPRLPAKTPPTGPSPQQIIQVGDEIIVCGEPAAGPPWGWNGCQRGAFGTAAATHAAGAEVKGLLQLWGFFLLDPDSTLADEVTSNFAEVVNDADFDMLYFDASDGIQDAQMDRWYYLNKMHLGYYKKLKKDVLYQTSNGTGSDLTWHLVPRSASADGHGDLKGYLDDRLPGMLGMAANYTRSDVGWYYMFKEVRPDQIEYVCAKTIGIDGSISIETSLESMESHPQGRQMLEMIGRYEECRLARFFPASVREKLKEPQRDFKLFADGQGGWSLYRAAYAEPRFVDVLDGQQNVWAITNDQPVPCRLGVEVTRSAKEAPTADYNDPQALTIESFDELGDYTASARNAYAQFVQGGDKVVTPDGVARAGVTLSLAASAEDPKVGPRCAVFSAVNAGGPEAWGGVGRRFAAPLDLSAHRALALWIYGDGKGEMIRFQLWDSKGQYANWLPAMNYTGWRLHVFPMADAPQFDWSSVDYLLLYFNSVPAQAAVQVRFDDLRALPALLPMRPLRLPSFTVGEARATYDVTLQPRQGLTDEGPGGARFWPGNMQPSTAVTVSGGTLELQPGANTVTFSCDRAADFPAGVQVLLYRLWPLEP